MRGKFGEDRPRIYIDAPPPPDEEGGEEKKEEEEKRGVEIIPVMPDDGEEDEGGV